jgi:DHA1 family multidrug resistance protein-like MFS transporter
VVTAYPGAVDKPRRNVPWRTATIVLAGSTAVESLLFSQLWAFRPAYLAELGVSPSAIPSWTAAMTSISFGLGLVLAPVWGALGDRFTYRAVIMRTYAVQVLTFVALATAQNVWLAFVCSCLTGLALGNTGAMLALMSGLVPRSQRGRTTGLIGGAVPIGAAAGPALGALLIPDFGVRELFWFDGALALLTLALIATMVKEPTRATRVREHTFLASGLALREVANGGSLRALFVFSTVAACAWMLVTPLVPVVIMNVQSSQAAATRTVGVVLTVSGLATALASPLWGHLIDRCVALRVLTASALAGCVSLVWAAFAPPLLQLACAIVLSSVFGIASTIACMTLIPLVAPPDRRGAILGLTYAPTYAAGLIAPPLGAALLAAGEAALFGAAAAITLLSPLVLRSKTFTPAPEPSGTLSAST